MSTISRIETKFVVRPEQREALLERLRDRLGEPKACEVRSAYFDGFTGGLARLALRDPGFHVTVRSREYDPDDETRGGAVWLEVKVRHGERTVKSRRAMDAARVGRILATQDLYVMVAELRREDAVIEPRLHRVLRPFAGRPGVRPVGVVACRRIAFQDRLMRVTLDLDLSYCPPPEGLYGEGRGLRGAPLPAPWFREPAAILEVKWDGSFELNGMTSALAPIDYSKFVKLVRERMKRAAGGTHADLLRRD